MTLYRPRPSHDVEPQIIRYRVIQECCQDTSSTIVIGVRYLYLWSIVFQSIEWIPLYRSPIVSTLNLVGVYKRRNKRTIVKEKHGLP